MEHIEILQDVKELLITREHWIKGIIVHHENSSLTDSVDDDSCGWCLLSAIDNVVYHNGIDRKTRDEVQEMICEVLEEQRDIFSIIDFNLDPSIKHSDVLNVLDETIVSCG